VALDSGHVQLWRNREFVLLESGRLLSTAGTASTGIAYPLLVLALTSSPAKAGLVGFARLAPYALLALPAGVAADRWNRKSLMIGADVVRALMLAGLAVAVQLDHAGWPLIAAIAFAEGAGAVVFGVAQAGALRAIVPRRQLPAAVGAQRARSAAVDLAGPPLGGALFAVGPALPFAVDSASYAFSIVSLAAIRTPFQEERELESTRLRSQVAEGLRFLWRQPFIRATTFLYALLNVTIPALLLVVIVVGRRDGLSSSEIGGLVAAFGAALLAGALLSPLLRRRLSVRAIILLELWTALGSGLFLVWPTVWVLVAGMLPQAIVIPATDSVVVGYRVAVTPDRLLGRVESVRSNLARLIDPLGPLAAGLLLSATSARVTVAFFVGWSGALLAWGMASPAIRAAPSLNELDEAELR
jgi:Transmembrane secretion effector